MPPDWRTFRVGPAGRILSIAGSSRSTTTTTTAIQKDEPRYQHPHPHPHPHLIPHLAHHILTTPAALSPSDSSPRNMASNSTTGGTSPGALSKLKNRFSRSFNTKTSPQQPPASAPKAEAASPQNESSGATANVSAPAASASQRAPTSNKAQQSSSAPAPPTKDETSRDAAPGDLVPNYSSSARSLGPPKAKLRQLYPEIEPFKTGRLRVASEEEGDHELHWELSGKEGGYPVVFLHGGPGGGCSADDRRWFDPQHYQILTFDQRGAGKSTPAAELKGNTTWDLVEDIEKMRKEVAKVEKWHVFGGSWGSTLSLAYAQTHPDRVSALILRGIFTLRRAELLFFYQEGSSFLWPEQFEPFLNHIPVEERDDMIAAYYKRLTSDDPDTRLAAARIWSTWENATSKLYLDHQNIAKADDDLWSLQFARIESHYFQNRGWMDDGSLLRTENIAKITHIPTAIVQGRYDVVCPAKSCWDLRNAWVEAQNRSRSDAQKSAEDDAAAPARDRASNLELFIVPDAGHASREPGTTDKLLYATDKFRAIKA
ncbi:unnamed protein product [Parajaminaea phylloscopi]